MDIERRIGTFIKLGYFLRQFASGNEPETSEDWLAGLNNKFMAPAKEAISEAALYNPWFTEENIKLAFSGIGKMLMPEKVEKWAANYYSGINLPSKRKVGVVMAGNVPVVGFHDMFCVLMSGHSFYGKLSSKDEKLIPLLADVISDTEPGIEKEIHLENRLLKDFDAVIATGSNNSSRYFDYYFGKYPHIIRKNRNSAAVLNGSETSGELKGLADDVFRYFGLGCRNVSKLFLPVDYDLSILEYAFSGYSQLTYHSKWDNNYRYRKTIFLMNSIPHFDTGFVLICENEPLASPVAVIHYEHVENEETAWKKIEGQKENIQCVASSEQERFSSVPFGKTQEPELWDYADNTDTMEFLLNL